MLKKKKQHTSLADFQREIVNIDQALGQEMNHWFLLCFVLFSDREEISNENFFKKRKY